LRVIVKVLAVGTDVTKNCDAPPPPTGWREVRLTTPFVVSPGIVIVCVVPTIQVWIPLGKELAGPVTPVAPIAPVGPVDPIAPVAPIAPVDPVDPIAPVAPIAPVGPVGPIGPPDGPVGPVAPPTLPTAAYNGWASGMCVIIGGMFGIY
jgi:hypothetical protein